MRLFPLIMATVPLVAHAQAFVEYPSHPATYGDHTVNTTWTGGPTTVTLTFESDETILHEDGNGQSQRTARNTLNYTPPSDPSNPQDYDDLDVINIYGGPLPLLQQMSADGTSTLRFEFGVPVTSGFDFFVTDVDTDDDMYLRAFGPGDVALDMTNWSLVAEGDLSLYKNTGTEYSDVIAPNALVDFAPAAVHISAADDTNYNRSYSIFRAPVGVGVTRFELEFTGVQNSASRSQAGTGSHVYVGLSTSPPLSDVESTEAISPGIRSFKLLSTNPGNGQLRFAVQLAHSGDAEITLFSANGRRALSQRAQLSWNVEEIAFDASSLAPGVYLARLSTARGTATLKVTRITPVP